MLLQLRHDFVLKLLSDSSGMDECRLQGYRSVFGRSSNDPHLASRETGQSIMSYFVKGNHEFSVRYVWRLVTFLTISTFGQPDTGVVL